MKPMASYLLVLIGFIPAMSHAFIYEVKVLKKWNPELKRHNIFIGLSDFHDKTHAATPEQLNKIESFLAQCDDKKTRIMLEDLSSKGSGGRFCCGRFMVNSRGGILGGLAQYCLEKKLPVENVEYRYCRVSSLGPVLNNMHVHIGKFASVNDISVSALVKEIQDIITEVQSYKDGDILSNYYAKGINEISAELKKLRMAYNTHHSVAEYLALYSSKSNRLDVLKRLLTFDSGLLDFKLIHGIVNAPEERVVTIAGGSHITRVTEVLEKLGYEVAYATPVNYLPTSLSKTSVGASMTDEAFALRPQALDLSLLEAYK